MSRNFTFPEKKYLWIAVCILWILNAGCNSKTDDSGSGIRLSADQAENSHLKHILFGRNRDSVSKYAEADYIKQKYYIFWAGMPGEAKFADYLAAYAKKRYNLILIECGVKNRPGAYYYNKQMAVFLLKAKKKTPYAIYLEAKDRYNKVLPFM